MYEMGQQAMGLLIGLLRGEASPPMVTIPGELVIRASTGARFRTITAPHRDDVSSGP